MSREDIPKEIATTDWELPNRVGLGESTAAGRDYRAVQGSLTVP